MTKFTLTAAAVALSVALAGPAHAQQDTSRTQRDSTRVQHQSYGDVTSVARIDNEGMSRARVRTLQQRLNDMGCDAGPVDGLIGPRTRDGIACAREQLHMLNADVATLLRNLERGAEPGTPMHDTTSVKLRDTSSTMGDTAGRMRLDTSALRRDTALMRRDTSMFSDSLRLRMRDTLHDTTRIPPRMPMDSLRDSTRIPPDSTRRPPR